MTGNRAEQAQTRESGMSLIELVIALVLLSVMVMATGMTLVYGFSQRQDSFQHYQRMSQLRDVAASIQNNANLPPDLINDEGVGAIYVGFHDQDIDIDEDASVRITCFINETSVPAILGGPQDLNFDGDMTDDLSNQSNGSDAKVVPMRLTMTFGPAGAEETLVIHRLITVTTNE